MFGSEVKGRCDVVGQLVADLCTQLDPVTVAIPDVPIVFNELVAMRKRLDGAILRMTARYEESGAWKGSGAKDFEDDLSRKTGTSKSSAKRSARTSKRLKKRPKTDDALRNGKLSPDQADAVTSGADASPEDEDDLLDSAAKDPLHTTRDKAARARAKADKDRAARHRRQHKLRGWRRWVDEDGMYNYLLRATPETGAEIDATLAPLFDRAAADSRHAGRLDTYEACAADVVADLLSGRRATSPTATDSPVPSEGGGRTSPTATDSILRSEDSGATRPTAGSSRSGPYAPGRSTATGTGRAASGSGPPGSAPPGTSKPRAPDSPGGAHSPDTDPPGAAASDPAAPDLASRDSVAPDSMAPDSVSPDERLPDRARNQAVRPDRKVIAFIDVAALNRGTANADETCEIAGVGPVSVASIRAMLSDATASIVIRDGVDILNVTHLKRNATAHQRTALEARGYQCEIEGCGTTHHLDIDHVTGWTLNHQTRLDDLSWLCRNHHDQKTRGNLVLLGPPLRRRLAPRNRAAAKPTQFRLAF